jgi:hypothetical protein
MFYITDGYFRWTVNGDVGRLDFRMEFEDGLLAEGYADISMKYLEKNTYL